MIGSTLYLFKWKDDVPVYNPKPCPLCMRFIKNAGIDKIIAYHKFEEDNGEKIIPIITEVT